MLNIYTLNNMENSDLEIALLGFLFDGPKHGYELHKEISDPAGIGGVWRVKIGKMYSMFKKLESKDFIRATSEQDGNRPLKNILFLTKQGKSIFYKWMRSPIKHGRDLRILFLLKIYFIKKIKSVNRKDLILIQKEECENWKERYQLGPQENKDENSFNWFVRKYRSSQIDGFINWLDWCGEQLERKND